MWEKGQLGDFSGKVLTNVNFKNLTEQLEFRGRQEHYNAYVKDVIIRQQEDGTEVVEFREDPSENRERWSHHQAKNNTTSNVQHQWQKKRSSAAIQALVVQATQRNEEHRATLSTHHKSS